MFSGRVIRGEGIARSLGYPTANLQILPADTKLRDGVYAAWAVVSRQRYPAALVIQHAVKKVEVYLLDYTGPDLYDAIISIDPVGQVSSIEQLATTDLKKKIARDILLVKDILAGNF